MADGFYEKLTRQRRASDVVEIVLRLRNGKEIIFSDKSVCPICGSKLVREVESEEE